MYFLEIENYLLKRNIYLLVYIIKKTICVDNSSTHNDNSVYYTKIRTIGERKFIARHSEVKKKLKYPFHITQPTTTIIYSNNEADLNIIHRCNGAYSGISRMQQEPDSTLEQEFMEKNIKSTYHLIGLIPEYIQDLGSYKM